jgi:hypothetical protein
MDYAASISKFAAVAHEYCAWCEGPRNSDPQKLHLEATHLLARVYAAGFELPDVTLDHYPAPPDVPENTKRAIFKSFTPLPFQYYREIFNPSVDSTEEPVVGDIADDLTDIYLDLKGGLAFLEQGCEPEGVWHWRYLFGIHWGRHATSALRALHCYKFPDE